VKRKATSIMVPVFFNSLPWLESDCSCTRKQAGDQRRWLKLRLPDVQQVDRKI